MIEKFKTLAWFAQRPSHWQHAVALVLRKAQTNHDNPVLRREATQWAAARAMSVEAALAEVGLAAAGADYPGMNPAAIAAAHQRAMKSKVQMGGAGDLELLFAVTAISGATTAVETGVAYGWSSLAILSAMAGRAGARLISVDMPYPKMDNEEFVGIVVPEDLHVHWTLIRKPDRPGLVDATMVAGRTLDLVHYDSDKSSQGRRYAYPLLWDALRPGGIFISDDIQDNFAFRDFMAEKAVPFAVTESEGKFIGIACKP